MKSLIGEIFRAIKCLCRQEDKGGRGWRRSRPTVVIGQRGGGIWGEHGPGGIRGGYERDILFISSVKIGNGGY